MNRGNAGPSGGRSNGRGGRQGGMSGRPSGMNSRPSGMNGRQDGMRTMGKPSNISGMGMPNINNLGGSVHPHNSQSMRPPVGQNIHKTSNQGSILGDLFGTSTRKSRSSSTIGSAAQLQ